MRIWISFTSNGPLDRIEEQLSQINNTLTKINETLTRFIEDEQAATLGITFGEPQPKQ